MTNMKLIQASFEDDKQKVMQVWKTLEGNHGNAAGSSLKISEASFIDLGSLSH